jgi:hypothetical protein
VKASQVAQPFRFLIATSNPETGHNEKRNDEGAVYRKHGDENRLRYSEWAAARSTSVGAGFVGLAVGEERTNSGGFTPRRDGVRAGT